MTVLQISRFNIHKMRPKYRKGAFIALDNAPIMSRPMQIERLFGFNAQYFAFCNGFNFIIKTPKSVCCYCFFFQIPLPTAC